MAHVSECCFYCRHFDPDDTGVPVCKAHRKFTSGDWICNLFESMFGAK